MRRFSLTDLVISVSVLALVALTLVPAVARMQRSYPDARCQSNMQRWAEAMALYCQDNGGRCPTNRAKSGSGVSSINHYQALSPGGIDPATAEPYRFYYSINWVEALYPYVWKSAKETSQDWKAFRRCPAALSKTWPVANSAGYPFPSMTYVLNSNLVEQSPHACRDPRTLMMMREYYCVTIAMLRPMISTTGSSASVPQYPFNSGDQYAAAAENADPSVWQPHGGGSYILFADGHIRHFTLDYFPSRTQISASACWDSDTLQWWNWGPGSGKPAELVKKIAVTP